MLSGSLADRRAWEGLWLRIGCADASLAGWDSQVVTAKFIAELDATEKLLDSDLV
jgi:hypothetical protein